MRILAAALFPVALFVPILAAAEVGDPTAALVPTIECESTTCQEAATALSNEEYGEAAKLFAAHFDAASDQDGAGAWLVHAAYANYLAGQWDEAAQLYVKAADQVEQLREFLLTQAVRATLEGSVDRDIIARAFDTGALDAGFEDGFFLAAQAQTLEAPLPEAAVVASALEKDDREKVCPWLIERLGDADGSHDEESTLFDLAHSYCVDEDYDAALAALDYEPSATARMIRADHLAWAVRFRPAIAELDAIDDGALSEVDQCRADFRRARSHFRLRQYSAAEVIYRQIVDDCTDPDAENQRVRSLYAVGNRNYHRGRLDDAEKYFTTLYEEYPYRSHADDALFFLARIERARDDGDRDREKELLIEALENYPQEDMIHEFAWEVYEPVFRRGDYKKFIDEVTALPLPDWDAEYFSQGRLEYFVGLAHQRLGDIDDAARYWQLAWVKYPFSFYGYLGHLRLLEHDRQPEALQAGPLGQSVDWFDDNFEGTGADILARAGHLAGACDFEAGRLSAGEPTRSDRWRLATLCHQAGNYTFSHNIARRQIPGRPWAAPQSGRLARWHVAWPDPFGPQLAAAVDTHGPDEPELYVHPGFASSIMREESGFQEDVVSWAGALGLMQLMPATAREHDDAIDGIASPDRLMTAEINIPVGIDHLARLSRRFDGHPVLMTAAYNAGSGRVNGWLRRQPSDEIALFVEDIPFLETRNYTKRVIGSYAAYQILQGEQTLDDRIILPAR